MKTPEGKLKDQVKAFLKERGAYYHMSVPTGYGTPTVDFVGSWRGHFFAIETKAPGGKPTARQQLTLNAIAVSGGKACWTDNFEDFIRVWDVIWKFN